MARYTFLSDVSPSGIFNWAKKLINDLNRSETPEVIVSSLPDVNTAPGAYGGPTQIPVVTVDIKGRVLSVTLAEVAAPDSDFELPDIIEPGIYGGAGRLVLDIDAQGRVNAVEEIADGTVGGHIPLMSGSTPDFVLSGPDNEPVLVRY